jgi:disulfide bond formation protein DsbB
MPLARSRHLFVLVCIVATLALSAAIYIEKTLFLRPCPTCFVQRACLVLIALTSALGWLQARTLRVTRCYASGTLLAIVTGAASAMRQLWLQVNAPLLERACQPNLFHLDKSEALLQTLKVLVLGSPDCAVITWTLLDMSLAEWSLLTFAGLGVISFMQLLQR